jgi:pimeloyl-ACP methyl ester carboxylesterase
LAAILPEKEINMKSKRILEVLILLIIISANNALSQETFESQINYGNNEQAGTFIEVNGVKIYFETYGQGSPLVLIHGNGGNIEGMKYQIEYFSKDFAVIALDYRGRGKSELGNDSLTYMNMTRDVNSLLEYLELDSAYIVGRSDGGIIGLLMGIHYPQKVKKIVAFGANLWPDSTALYPFEVKGIKEYRLQIENMMSKGDTTQDWNLLRQRMRLIEFQPNITKDELSQIEVPVLVLSCDRDLIMEEHTLFIYRNIPKSNLCIFPGETHWITDTNPVLFNNTVDKFLKTEFRGEEIRK